MKRIPAACVAVMILAFSTAVDGDTRISSADELAAAVARAEAGDVLTLTADVQWDGPRPLTIPSGVTLDGAGHTITHIAESQFIDQVGARGVVLRNLGLAVKNYLAWNVAVKDGDLRLEHCEVRCRMIAWERGTLALDGCRVTIQLPAGNDHGTPVGVHGGGASFAAASCTFHVGWDVQHVDGGYFRNFGGDPASRLSITRCTVIGAPDPNHTSAGRHLTVFQSDNAAGPAYETTVTDSIIFAEVKSVFRSSGTGRVTSSHNNNAGMLRNPGILASGDPLRTSFYQLRPGGQPVSDKTGDIEEPNPFVDAAGGDYRIVAGSDSATAASDGGPLGADPVVIAREMNAYNLEFDRYVLVEHRTRGYDEALFDGWPVRRDGDQQHCTLVKRGSGDAAMRLETWRNDAGSGGPRRLVTQSAFQSFVTVPGWQYTVRASARRGRMPLAGAWDEVGPRVQAVLGVADGIAPDPAALVASTTFDGPEDQWWSGRVEVIAPSNHLTVHLIHRTDGAWNRVDWNDISITARAPLGAKVPQGLRGPLLGYINTVPPESDADRTARHARVAQRRANLPILVHRGAHKFDPENTLEAYDRVMALGADGVEFDPRITRDGIVYTFHDEEVGRMLAGGGRGDRMTYYEILSLPFKNLKGNATRQTRVPTVVSLLQLARERAMLLHFDVKEKGIEDLLITLLDHFDMWDHVVMVTPSDDSNRLRFHPKTKLMEYKPTPNFDDPESVRKVLAGPGDMFFTDADPSPVVKGLGRQPPGEQPLPADLRAWWWLDGTSAPAEPREAPAPGR